MTEPINIDKIKRVSREEFKELLKSWMDDKEIKKTLQKKLRQQLVSDFQKTEISRRLDAERQQGIIKSRDYVIEALQAENLYANNNHFALSILFTESRYASLLPNFEKRSKFKFKKEDVRELIELLGIAKTDRITDKISVAYETSKKSESLLSVLLKILVDSYISKSNEKRNIATQSEINRQQQDENEQSADRLIPAATTMKTSSPPKARTNRSLYTRDYKASSKVVAMKQKRPKDLMMIVSTLESMSKSINLISEKLDDCSKDDAAPAPAAVESQSTIVSCVGTIMTQLTSVIGNFESLCKDIKHANEASNASKDEKNFENWMEDLQSSDNGRRLMRKLQKTFTKVVDDEKIKMKRDYQLKLDRERNKLSKYYARAKKRTNQRRDDDVDIKELSAKITKEIGEIYESTCLKLKDIDKEENEFLRSLEKDDDKKMKTKTAAFTVEQLKIDAEDDPTNLDDCQQIHSTEESSIKSSEGYTSSDFESDDENN